MGNYIIINLDNVSKYTYLEREKWKESRASEIRVSRNNVSTKYTKRIFIINVINVFV